MTIRSLSTLVLAVVALSASEPAFAQDPPASPPVYTGSVGGGFAITGGNTDTRNFNLSAELVRDPGTRNLIKGTASYLRGNLDGVLNLDRTGIVIRDEFTLSGRTYLYGQIDYLRDPFKGIVFLWAPTGGVGHRLVDTETRKLEVSLGAGGVIERNPGLESNRSGSVAASQRFQQSLSSAATLTQSLSSLWKTNDFSDSLTNFALGLSTTLAGNLELKIEFIDSYKNKPSSPALKKNDTTLVTAFVVKF
jgi:putative salt-induced outer membrane protein